VSSQDRGQKEKKKKGKEGKRGKKGKRVNVNMEKRKKKKRGAKIRCRFGTKSEKGGEGKSTCLLLTLGRKVRKGNEERGEEKGEGKKRVNMTAKPFR